MATAAVAKTEVVNVKSHYIKYTGWCLEQNNVDRSPEGFEQWDIDHNQKRVHKAFRKGYDLEKYAFKSLFRMYFYNYARIVVEVKGRKLPFQETRKIDGVRIDFSRPETITPEQFVSVQEKAKLQARNAALRFKTYNLSFEETINIFTEQAKEVYEIAA